MKKYQVADIAEGDVVAAHSAVLGQRVLFVVHAVDGPEIRVMDPWSGNSLTIKAGDVFSVTKAAKGH